MNYILYFLTIISALSFSNAQCNGSMSIGNYTASWITVEGSPDVQFNVSAATTLWVAVGFSLTNSMVCKLKLNVHVTNIFIVIPTATVRCCCWWS